MYPEITKDRRVATAQTPVTPSNASLAALRTRGGRPCKCGRLSIAGTVKRQLLTSMLVSLFGDPGGFAYDTCQAWGSPGMRWMGCDEFFPDHEVYKDLRKSVGSGCSPTKVQFVTEGTIPAYLETQRLGPLTQPTASYNIKIEKMIACRIRHKLRAAAPVILRQ